MPDTLQSDLPLRAPVADAAAANKTGIVMPPDVEDASSALDKQFEDVMGRQPGTLDNIPDRDREALQKELTPPAEPTSASEIPEDDNALDPAEAARIAAAEEKRRKEEEEAARKLAKEQAEKPATDPSKEEAKGEDLLDKLLGKEPAKADDGKPAATEPKPEDDPYKDHKLRADASDRTKTTFEDLKRTAREREAQVRAEADKLRKELEDLKKTAEEASKRAAAPEVEKELKELREFRATFDTERDPEFNKKYDERRERNNSTIFETLQKNGLKQLVVEQVQKLPYDQQVEQISRWAEKLPPRDKLAVTSRLADNENIETERSAALAEVKARAAEILAQKQAAPEKSREAFVQEAVATLKPIVPQLGWLHPKEIPANASPKDKADLEKHNADAAEAQRQLLGFLQDESARSRSLLALAGVLAPRYRAELQSVRAELEAARKELGAIKEAGRLSKTARSSATAAAAAPKVDLFNTSADEAMEEAWKQMSGGN